MTWRPAMVCLLLLSAVPAARAQSAAGADAWGTQVRAGQSVRVETTSGERVRGKVTAVDTTGLDLDHDGQARHLPVETLTSVAVVGDPVKNGFLIGAGIGAIGGLSAAANFSGEFRADDLRQGGLPFAVFGAALYGGIGALIDWLHRGSTVVYRAAPGRVAMSVAPTSGGVRVAGVVRW